MTEPLDDLLLSRIMELHGQGYYCAQILAILVLEELDMEAPDLVRAMSGMTGGMGFSGEACGVLTGGAAVLGYLYGEDESGLPHPRLQPIVADFVERFRAHIGTTYGGTRCDAILADEPANQWLRCGNLVGIAFEDVMQIIEHEGGFDV